MIETINGKAYVKKGDKVYEVGGGGSNFIFANSKDELPDPSTVPENTIGFVPSEESAGGGLPVVEITSNIFNENFENVVLTTDENTALTAALATGLPCVIKFTLDQLYVAVFSLTNTDDNAQYIFKLNGITVTFSSDKSKYEWEAQLYADEG